MNETGNTQIGIIGPSWWVNYWHLTALQNHPYAEIAAVCGATARDEGETRAKYGPHVRVYTDMDRMLDEVPLDGVIVCLPNDLHHPATMAAFKRGRPVLCEKPVAMSAEQAREMAETAKAKELIGMCCFPYRGNPAVQTFKRLVAEGWVGTPLTISGSYHGGFGLRRSPNWRGLRARSGAGILGDLGSHLIDLARYVSGDEFASVCAHTMTALWNDPAPPTLVRTEDPRVGVRNDDSCAFLAEFKSGMQGIFHTSWVAHQGALTQHQEIEIYGDKGRLHFLATHAGTFLRGMRTGEKRWETIPVEGIHAPTPGEEEDEDYFRPGRHDATSVTYRFIEAVRTEQKDVAPNLEDGFRAQLVIDAVIQASAERRWTDIGE